MRLIPLTPMGSHFVQAEIVERYADDLEAHDRPHIYNAAEIVREHMERSGGKSLAVVPNVDVMVLEVLNALDDAIVYKRTEKEFGLDGRAARALHKSGSALYSQVVRALKSQGSASNVAGTTRRARVIVRGRSGGATKRYIYLDRRGVVIAPGQRVRFRVGTGYLNATEGTGTVRGVSDYHQIEIVSDVPITTHSTRWSEPAHTSKVVSVGTQFDHKRRAMIAETTGRPGSGPVVETWVEVMPSRTRKRTRGAAGGRTDAEKLERARKRARMLVEDVVRAEKRGVDTPYLRAARDKAIVALANMTGVEPSDVFQQLRSGVH